VFIRGPFAFCLLRKLFILEKCFDGVILSGTKSPDRRPPRQPLKEADWPRMNTDEHG
jgi:hypothetical protein